MTPPGARPEILVCRLTFVVLGLQMELLSAELASAKAETRALRTQQEHLKADLHERQLRVEVRLSRT